MDLSRIRIQPRKRSAWESIDLGFIMLRQWWKPLYLSWFLPSAITFCLLNVVFYSMPWLALFLTWWLKPLWDRGPLYVASRAMFGERVQVSSFLVALPSLYTRSVLGSLLWRRFNGLRALSAPVIILEQLSGAQRVKRMKVLQYPISTACHWLIILCLHVEILLVFGFFALLAMFLPSEMRVDIDWAVLFLEDQGFNQIVYVLVYLSMALVAPIYATAGFALYISRRIDLEAWDVEIKFRDMAARHDKEEKEKSLASWLNSFLLVGALWGLGVFYSPDVYSDESSVVITSEDESKTLINEVLQGPEFHDTEKTLDWRYIESEKSSEDENILQKLLRWILESLRSSGDEETSEDNKQEITWTLMGAKFFEWFLWGFAVVVSIYFVFRYRLALYFFLKGRSRSSTRPPHRGGVTSSMKTLLKPKEPLPTKVPQKVLVLYREQKYREAMSFLYQSALAYWSQQHQLNIIKSDTEEECFALITESGNPQWVDFMTDLKEVWLNTAYGHKELSLEHVESLCRQWGEVFQ